jgi:small subunit ribosomal protein S6
MAANTYEFMLIFDPNRVASDLPGSVGQIHAVLERNHAEILASRQWDERRLAYPVRGHKKGLYYLMYVRMDGKNLVHIERDLALNENVLRSMILKIDPKLVDTLLAVARDEHALALQSVPDDASDIDGFGRDARGDGFRGPRRGRRD